MYAVKQTQTKASLIMYIQYSIFRNSKELVPAWSYGHLPSFCPSCNEFCYECLHWLLEDCVNAKRNLKDKIVSFRG